jgi:large subunit ribosomal protein L25
MVKELQRDPVKETKLIHADLTRVSMDQKIQMEVPVQTVGTSPGVKLGGVMNILQRSLRIWVTPSNIPEVIDIDISELEVNDKLFVKDLTLPDGMKVADREDEVVLICLPPRAMRGAKGVAESDLLPGEEGAEEGAEGDAEPEVIGKGKQEEEGE